MTVAPNLLTMFPVPTARLRTVVGYSSEVYMYSNARVPLMAILAIMVRVTARGHRSAKTYFKKNCLNVYGCVGNQLIIKNKFRVLYKLANFGQK